MVHEAENRKNAVALASGASDWFERMVWSRDQERMEQKVKAMICRFGGCCTKGLNCPWLHTLEETQIFKDELELRRRKLAGSVRADIRAPSLVP